MSHDKALYRSTFTYLTFTYYEEITSLSPSPTNHRLSDSASPALTAIPLLGFKERNQNRHPSTDRLPKIVTDIPDLNRHIILFISFFFFFGAHVRAVFLPLSPVSTLSFYLLFSFGLLLVSHLFCFFHILCFKINLI